MPTHRPDVLSAKPAATFDYHSRVCIRRVRLQPTFAPQPGLHLGYDWIRTARSDEVSIAFDEQPIGTMAQSEHRQRTAT